MSSESVKVMVRVRPFNERERSKNNPNIITIESGQSQISLNNPGNSETQKLFTYDAVFHPEISQENVYEEAAFKLVESVLEGYNGTIFAYGQTGCGKTHTMMGVPDNNELKGIIPRAFAHIFGNIESTAQKSFLVRCSYIEIYNEEIHDLIGQNVKAKLELKESQDKSVYIKDVSMHVVKSIAEIEKLMLWGLKNRSIGETAMNKDSSRSHSVFTIYIETVETDAKGNQRITLGKLNLVDLAGSERQSKTQATGERLKEANKINLSLSALGNVISALVDGKSSHVPYRDSKLTRLLQDSLGGNTKTVMIANVSPSGDSYDETLGTLRYASRAKCIKNQPKVNEDPKDALLREYADEIKKLKNMLESGNPIGTMGNIPDEKAERRGRLPSDDQIAFMAKMNQKDEEINNERKKREELESKLAKMQSDLLKGGTPDGGKSSDDEPEEKKQYQQMLQKIKEHENLLKEKAQKETEIAAVEKKHASLQEEVEEQRKIIQNLKKKCKNYAAEIKDLAKEHEVEKEDLLDSIRVMEKEVQIKNSIISNLLSPQEVEKLKAASRWCDIQNEFVIPPFIIKQKKVSFPKLSKNQALDMIQEEWNNRELEIRELQDENKKTPEINWSPEKTGKFDSTIFKTNREFQTTAKNSMSEFYKNGKTQHSSFDKPEHSYSESKYQRKITSPTNDYSMKISYENNYHTMHDRDHSYPAQGSKLIKSPTADVFKKKNPIRGVHLEPLSMGDVMRNVDSNVEKGLGIPKTTKSTLPSLKA